MLSAMSFRGSSIGWLLVLAGLSACTAPVGPSPPSAHQAVADEKGLEQLFVKECVQQSDAQWARSRWRYFRARMCPWPWSDDSDDCVARVDGEVSWKVPARVGGAVVVSMNWFSAGRPDGRPGPPDGLLDCRLSVSDPLGPDLHRIAVAHGMGDALSTPSTNHFQNDHGSRDMWTIPVDAKRELMFAHDTIANRDEPWTLELRRKVPDWRLR
jgi:hypothetical protein